MTSEVPTDKTILIADDDRATREWLASVLQAEGYRVILAANGQEALDHLRMGPQPDLILLDMLMPVLDGWHFLAQLKRQTLKPSVAVLIVTATILTRAWAQAQGCSGFLKKPIQADELRAEVRHALATPQTGSPTSAPP